MKNLARPCPVPGKQLAGQMLWLATVNPFNRVDVRTWKPADLS
jgi:hypothetical protein